jgi:transketolase
MTKSELTSMQSTALRVREHIIRLSAGGGCFIGASLSCVELLVYLYAGWLRRGRNGDPGGRHDDPGVRNDDPGGRHDDPERDFLFLSKGHDVPALYGTFVEMGLLDGARLRNHLSTADAIYWHPNRSIPGVEFHSGSLGHLPAVAAGVALDCKLRGLDNQVVVITGDGELNEGSVWETLLVANAHGLDNLTLVVDRNQFQANTRTEELVPLEPLADKFEAFGCRVRRIDGHDLNQLDKAFGELRERGGESRARAGESKERAGESRARAGAHAIGNGAGEEIAKKGQVNVIIADTVRGKGLPSIEARADRWFCAFSDAEVEQLLEELHGNELASIESETLIVR